MSSPAGYCSGDLSRQSNIQQATVHEGSLFRSHQLPQLIDRSAHILVHRGLNRYGLTINCKS